MVAPEALVYRYTMQPAATASDPPLALVQSLHDLIKRADLPLVLHKEIGNRLFQDGLNGRASCTRQVFDFFCGIDIEMSRNQLFAFAIWAMVSSYSILLYGYFHGLF